MGILGMCAVARVGRMMVRKVDACILSGQVGFVGGAIGGAIGGGGVVSGYV